MLPHEGVHGRAEEERLFRIPRSNHTRLQSHKTLHSCNHSRNELGYCSRLNRGTSHSLGTTLDSLHN